MTLTEKLRGELKSPKETFTVRIKVRHGSLTLNTVNGLENVSTGEYLERALTHEGHEHCQDITLMRVYHAKLPREYIHLLADHPIIECIMTGITQN